MSLPSFSVVLIPSWELLGAGNWSDKLGAYAGTLTLRFGLKTALNGVAAQTDHPTDDELRAGATNRYPYKEMVDSTDLGRESTRTDHGHVDKDRENYCEVTDTEVTCVFNYLLKKNPQSNKLTKRVERKEPLVIEVHKHTPKLAAFLRKFKPIATAIAGPGAHLLFAYQAKKDFGQQVSTNALSTRAGRKTGANMFTRMAKRGDLEPRLVPLAAGINKARHASVTEDRANAEDLTREEIDDQHRRRGQNPPRESVADTEYGHRAEGQLREGTEVRLHSLTRASELNDSFWMSEGKYQSPLFPWIE